MMPRSFWPRLLVALLIAALAMGGLYLVILVYPNHPGKIPSLPTRADAVPSPALPTPDPNILLQADLLIPWEKAKLELSSGHLQLQGNFLLPVQLFVGRRLRLVGPPCQYLRMDLWQGVKGVRLELAQQGMLTAYRLHRSSGSSLSDPMLNRDRRFHREKRLSRMDGPIAFKWGSDAPFSGMSAQDYAVRWTGFFHVPKEGLHRFRVRADDGARLWINGSLVVDAWTDRSMQWASGSIFLVRGWQAIVLEYHQAKLDAAVHLQWERPGKGPADLPRAWTTPAADETCDWQTRFKPAAVDPFEDPEKQGLLGTYFWGPTRYPPLPLPDRVELERQAPWDHSGPLAFDVVYRSGQLMMLHGDAILLRLPLERAPTLVVLEIDGRLNVLQLLADDPDSGP